MKHAIRALVWLPLFSLLIQVWGDAIAEQRGQRNNQPVTARLIVQIQYEQEDNAQTGDIRTSAKLKLNLSYTHGVQLSSIPNPGGSVDILDLPNAPVSAQGSINYSSQSESQSSDTTIFGSGLFAGNYQTPDAHVMAFWADETNGLDIRLESHGQLTGNCHEEITSNGKTQRSDDCDDIPGADTGLIELDKFQPIKEAQTPDAKFMTKLRLKFDVIAAPAPEKAADAYLDYNDPTWRGGRTKGDAKAGYKAEFDGFKQFHQPNLSGKKHLILSAQIVPGAPAAKVNLPKFHGLPPMAAPTVIYASGMKGFVFVGESLLYLLEDPRNHTNKSLFFSCGFVDRTRPPIPGPLIQTIFKTRGVLGLVAEFG